MIKRIIPALKWRARLALNTGLAAAEEAFPGRPEKPLAHPPVFIIGAPRSGSTLLYQVMTTCLDVSYLTNLHCYFFGAPSLVERFSFWSALRVNSDYQSTHGVTQGLLSASECGDFWYRFFRRAPQYVSASEVTAKDRQRIRQALYMLVNAARRPFVFKNMHCALRLGPLLEAAPESLFIIVNRDEVETAQSILATRKKIYDNYAIWWSMEPPRIDEIRALPPHEQAIEQVRHIYTVIEKDLKAPWPQSYVEISYEDLCRDPGKTLQTLEDFFARHHIAVARRCEPPVSFPAPKKQALEEEIGAALIAYAQK